MRDEIGVILLAALAFAVGYLFGSAAEPPVASRPLAGQCDPLAILSPDERERLCVD